jgi:signal transduction histidine kinase
MAVRPASTRGRTTLAAVLVVALALGAGSLVLLRVLRRSLLSSIDESVRLRAGTVASTMQSGVLPDSLRVGDSDTSFVQVLGSSGAVVSATPNIEGEPAFPVGTSGHIHSVSGLPIGDGTPFRVLVQTVPSTQGTLRVVSGGSLSAANESVAAVGRTLAVGAPLFLLLVGGITWLAVGRTLSPVEAIRSEVERISTLALDRRVPEPEVRDEVGRLARTMNEMLARLQAGDRRQRRFVADASHELRSPIAAIRAQLEVAVAHPGTTDWPGLAGDVLDDVDRVQRMVGQLLALARSDETAVPTDEAVDLDDIVLDEARRARGRDGVDVDTSRVSAARVQGSADQLHQVVRNLLDNARRHARSRVAVELQHDGDAAVLAVHDDGPGIPVSERQRVFERFTRLDDARTTGDGGAGLGLAISRGIVTAHHGSIAVEDAPQGARFVVRLPLAALALP